ncbi:FAD-dependent oxidoreductase [Halomonas sp. CUBES01]|uniref:FAD-dependent oxidoreductase n=1 Tax=Vreelandella gomseomensis TaxID=370766 RepID=A0ABU1GBB3_9GAMM|nr:MULTISPECIES: FAD-dependent oxidoreductase [Halomonas]MDR5874290.1 FAD-dependent oxidoreductase [Halomonas gomseomensis]MEC4768948.1 FAD-dependent oxidoreductase [Halomonas sp. CUBES01]
MPSSHAELTIVGTGMAGVGLARALRRQGDTRSLCLISADSGDDYSKPLLSTGFAKRLPPERLAQRSADELAASLDARVITQTTVSRLDATHQSLQLADGQALGYDRLVLATGAEPRVPMAIPDPLKPRCFTVNNLDDYRRFHRALGATPSRVAVIGAGLVGCEFANDLHAGGHDVSVIAPDAAPLPRLLPGPLGHALGEAFAEAGIHLALGRTLKTMALDDDGNVTLTLDNDELLTVDVLLMATGLVPRTALAEAAGLSVSANGIHVDRQLQTSHPAIHALGDAACVDGVNAMYVQPLQASAHALAATLAGTPTPVRFGAWPVIVKTPLLPVVAYPPLQPPGRWRIEGEGRDMTAIAEDKDGRLIGFALTGSNVRRKVELSRAAPALLG